MWRQQYSFSTMYSLSWNIQNVMEVENNLSLVGRICDIYMYNITYPRFLFELKATSQGGSSDKNLSVSLSVFQAICLIWHGKRVDSYALFYIYIWSLSRLMIRHCSYSFSSTQWKFTQPYWSNCQCDPDFENIKRYSNFLVYSVIPNVSLLLLRLWQHWGNAMDDVAPMRSCTKRFLCFQW